jgi:hypothetical protein
MRKAMVAFSRQRQPLEWVEVDIDRDVDLVCRYDSLVPVLCLGESEICHYFFDESALIAALALA